jgi:hypothetical protein
MDILFRDSANLNPLNVLDSGHSCALRFHIWSETSFLFFKFDLDVIQWSEFFDAEERRRLSSATPTETGIKLFAKRALPWRFFGEHHATSRLVRNLKL